MAKSRKKTTKADAEARVAELFGGAGEDEVVQALEQKVVAAADETREERLAVELSGPQPPPHEKNPRDRGWETERAWETFPLIDAVCSQCGGRLRYLGDGRASCRNGHANVGAEVMAAAINADAEPGIKGAIATPAGPSRVDVVGKKTGTGARVIFHERATTRLEQYDVANLTLMNPADQDLRDAFVKVTAALTPSERETFDGRALKETLRSHGARAVLLAVHPVAEAPDRAAKEETACRFRRRTGSPRRRALSGSSSR
jgi:hypothetical protein